MSKFSSKQNEKVTMDNISQKNEKNRVSNSSAETKKNLDITAKTDRITSEMDIKSRRKTMKKR